MREPDITYANYKTSLHKICFATLTAVFGTHVTATAVTDPMTVLVRAAKTGIAHGARRQFKRQPTVPGHAMTDKNSLACATAALMLFATLAAFNSDARASHDTEAVHDSRNAASQATTPPAASGLPTGAVSAASRTMPADDEVGARPVENPAASTITSANYIAIGTEVFTSLQSVDSYSGMPALDKPGAAIDAAPAPNLPRQAIDLLMLAIAGKPAALDVDISKTACNSGGKVEADTSLKHAGRISPGDRISLSLSDCRLAAHAHPLSGTAVFTFHQIDGTVSADQPWHAVVDVQFHELAIALAPNAIVGNGDMSVDIRQASQGHRLVSVRSARFSEEARSGLGGGIRFAPVAHTYRDYKALGTHAGASSSWDLSYELTTRNGYFYTSEFAVSTLEPMVFDGGSYPVSGEVKITGKNSSMTVTVQEGDMVRLDFSGNGDGRIDQTTFLPSSKLLDDGE
jgi:translation initiation factor IF-1